MGVAKLPSNSTELQTGKKLQHLEFARHRTGIINIAISSRFLVLWDMSKKVLK